MSMNSNQQLINGFKWSRPVAASPAHGTDVGARGKWKGKPHSRRLIRVVRTGSIAYIAIFLLSIVGYFNSTVRHWFDAGGGAGATFRSIVMWPLSLAFASGFFLLLRYHRAICEPYRKKAEEQPVELVPTAGSISDDVVGRDELCDALIESLDTGGTPRAHVIVGRMGTGKTAMLVLLTRRLAKMKAIPVPIHLRHATEELNFRKLAFDRFVDEVSQHMVSEAEAEKVWRWLLRQRRVVVLADGLEEALLSEDRAAERDNMIRQAIREANDQDLPLVIASRPHDPLRSLEATIVELEPLNEEAALEYVARGGGWAADPGTVARIVQTADFSEAPTYLQLARQLHAVGLLEHPTGQETGQLFEDTTLDRAGLRYCMLETWVEHLIYGHLYPEVALVPDARRAALDYLSALALVGLRNDSAVVAFSDLLGSPQSDSDTGEEFERAVRQLIAREAAGGTAVPLVEKTKGSAGLSPYPRVVNALEKRLEKTHCDAYMAATWGKKLGLVEFYGDRVRFQHSVMQAFLGARFMQSALHRGVMPQPAVQAPQPQLAISELKRLSQDSAAFFRVEYLPGRETSAPTPVDNSYFPAALDAPGRELLSALVLFSRSPAGRCVHTPSPQQTVWCPAEASRKLLLEAAERAMSDKSLLSSSDGSTHFKDAEARILKVPQGHAKALELYTAAIEVDAAEETSALDDIADKLRKHWANLHDRDPESLREAKMALVKTLGACVRNRAEQKQRRAGKTGKSADEQLGRVYQYMFALATTESSYRIRLAIALEIGAGGDTAFKALKAALAEPPTLQLPWEQTPHDDGRSEDAETIWRRKTLSAVLLPLLVGSAKDDAPDGDTPPMVCLKRWLAGIGDDRPQGITQLSLSTEVALAQGFKFAANRRHQHPCVQGSQKELADKALEMLGKTRFWYTRLTLLQAQTLWALPDDIKQASPSEGPEAHPEAEIRDWLLLPGESEDEHPFVRAAGDLAVKALKERKPEKYLWTDESIVVGQVGSRESATNQPRKHNLWIPYSIGWSALASDAQRLVADVLLLLNLAEQSTGPDERLDHLHRIDRSQKPFLPPCLTADPAPLNPSRTGAGESARPTKNCGCTFGLCPYPARSEQGTRMEFSEMFCRRQMSLISARRGRRSGLAAWQHDARPEALRRFWQGMGERAHDKNAGRGAVPPGVARVRDR